jgi:hypothetical protein
MFTVVRFCADESCPDETLMQIGERLNLIVKDAYGRRLDPIGKRFSVRASSNGEWDANLAETVQFIRKAMPLIEEGRASGVSIEVDAAIEPKDVREGLSESLCESRLH